VDRTERVKLVLKLNIYGQPPETRFDDFVDLARHAEDLGFDGVSVVDHLYLPPERMLGYSTAPPDRPWFLDAWTAISALAASTSRIRIGPQVSPLTFRHPALVARMGATVDLISDGRLLLQLGAGWHREEHETYGFPFPDDLAVRMDALREGVDVIRGLWTSEQPFSYKGEHYTIDGAAFWPKPVQQPHPPIWFGGTSRRVRKLVAAVGDGWSPAMSQSSGVAHDDYGRRLAEIRTWAGEQGRDPDAITAGLLVTTSVADDRATALEPTAILRRRPDYADLSPEEMTRRGILLWGTPDDCVRALEPYVEAGVRYFTLNFIPFGDMTAARRGMELYASQVLDRLQPS